MVSQIIPIPLRWSALKWQFREWRVDRALRTESGRQDFLRMLEHQTLHLSAHHLLRESLELPGDVVECGVYRGASLLRFAYTMSQAESNKALFGCDSFDGFPVESVRNLDVAKGRIRSRVATKFRHVSHVPARIHRLCKLFQFSNVELIPGYFHNTLQQFKDRELCFVHLDVEYSVKQFTFDHDIYLLFCILSAIKIIQNHNKDCVYRTACRIH